MSAAADLQALIPSQPSAQASRLLPSTEFRVASNLEELGSDRTNHLYNPVVSYMNHHMDAPQPNEDNIDLPRASSKEMGSA